MNSRIPVNRIEPVAVAARRLLHEGDIFDLSVRNLAIYVGCDPSTLQHRFGSRTSVFAHVAEWIGEAWLEVVYRETSIGQQMFDLFEVVGQQHLRGWLAMGELARGNDRVAAEVTRIEQEERRLLARALPPTSPQATQDAWVALVRGLQQDLAVRNFPLPIERARAATRTFLAGLSDATTPRSA